MYTVEQRRQLFWQNDAENGGYIRSQYDDIKRVLAEKDMEWVKERLKDIRLHAIKNTEFYKGMNVDDDFPVVNKSILIENYDKVRASGGYTEPVHISSTSGSTGTPFSVVQDMKKRKRTIADLQVFGELCDYPSQERMVFFRIISEKLRRTPEQEERENIFYFDSSDMGDEHLAEMAGFVIEKKPRAVMGYSSTIVELAKYIHSAGISSGEFGVSVIITIGEGISEGDQHLVETAFGCKVCRRYSDMELGIMGNDTGGHQEYILNWGSYYFECLKLDSDEPAEYGEVGRIVVTDLFNFAFPMIRYDTGDLGIMGIPDNGGLPVLKDIFGRSRDCVYSVDGRLISPAKISVMMWGAEGLRQWQFIQKSQSEYLLKLNVKGEADFTGIVSKLNELLGKDAKIGVEYVEEIPVVASSKRRAVICEWEKK